VEVKPAIQNRMIDGDVVMRASNIFFEVDPIVGARKTFYFIYRSCEGTYESEIADDLGMVIPDRRHRKISN
jgi:hypothetical protein